MGEATTLVRVTDSLYVRVEDVRIVSVESRAVDGDGVTSRIQMCDPGGTGSSAEIGLSPKAIHDRLRGVKHDTNVVKATAWARKGDWHVGLETHSWHDTDGGSAWKDGGWNHMRPMNEADALRKLIAMAETRIAELVAAPAKESS